MPKKRKNCGKNRHNRGRVGFVRCDVSGRAVPKDKAIKRFIVRNLVDASGQKDIQDKKYYNIMQIPKMYYKAYYCVSAAIHQRIVRPRNRKERKNRNPPPEVLKRWAAQAKRQRDQERMNMEGRGYGRGGYGRGGYGRGGYGRGGYGRGGYGRGGGRGQRSQRDQRTGERAQQRKNEQRDRDRGGRGGRGRGGYQGGRNPRTDFRGGMRGGGGRTGVRAGAGRSGTGRGGGTRGLGGR